MKKVLSFALSFIVLLSANTVAFAADSSSSDTTAPNTEATTTSFDVISQDEAEDLMSVKMYKYFTVTLTGNEGWVTAMHDNNLLDENVTVECVAFSDNVSSVDVDIVNTASYGSKHLLEKNVSEGETVGPYKIPWGDSYDVNIRFHSGNVSESNPGTVTIFVSDRN